MESVPSRSVAVKEAIPDQFEKTAGGHAFKGVLLEILLQEGIECRTAKMVLQHAQKISAFFVGQFTKRIIRIAVVKVNTQLGKLGFDWCEPVNSVSQGPLSEEPLHLGEIVAIQSFDNTPFKVGGKAFIEPEIAPGGIGDEIAGPRVR